jgi:hypothetical protein
MKATLVSASMFGLSAFGLLVSPSIAQGFPTIPLDPPCDPAAQGCDVPGATLLLPYFEVDTNNPNGISALPKQGPTVSFDPVLGGVVAHVTDRSGVTSQCQYQSDFYTRSFGLKANSTSDLRIVPAIPEFRDRPVNITCDNGTSTSTSTFF